MTDRADRPIAVGDLVMIVRGHECALQIKGGIPWRVVDFEPQRGGGWHCNKCNTPNLAPEALMAAVAPWNTPGNGIPLQWLKRIPPLDELESTRTDEKIGEPA